MRYPRLVRLYVLIIEGFLKGVILIFHIYIYCFCLKYAIYIYGHFRFSYIFINFFQQVCRYVSKFVSMFFLFCFKQISLKKKIDGVALNIIWDFISQCQTCTRKEDTSSMRIIVHKNRNVLHFELSFQKANIESGGRN